MVGFAILDFNTHEAALAAYRQFTIAPFMVGNHLVVMVLNVEHPIEVRSLMMMMMDDDALFIVGVLSNEWVGWDGLRPANRIVH